MFELLDSSANQAVFTWGFLLLGVLGAFVAADFLRTLGHRLADRRAGRAGELWH